MEEGVGVFSKSKNDATSAVSEVSGPQSHVGETATEWADSGHNEPAMPPPNRTAPGTPSIPRCSVRWKRTGPPRVPMRSDPRACAGREGTPGPGVTPGTRVSCSRCRVPLVTGTRSVLSSCSAAQLTPHSSVSSQHSFTGIGAGHGAWEKQGGRDRPCSPRTHGRCLVTTTQGDCKPFDQSH